MDVGGLASVSSPVVEGCCDRSPRLTWLLLPRTSLVSGTSSPSAVAASGPEDVSAGLRLLGRPKRRLAGVSALQPFRSRSWPPLPEEGGPTPESAGSRRGSRSRAARARAAEDRRMAGRGGGVRGAPPLLRPARWRPRDAHVTGAGPAPGGALRRLAGARGFSLASAGRCGDRVCQEPWGGFALGQAEASFVAAAFCPEVTF